MSVRAAVRGAAVTRREAPTYVAAHDRVDAGHRELRRCVLADRAGLASTRFHAALDRPVRAAGPGRVVVVRLSRPTAARTARARHSFGRRRHGALAWLRWKNRSATNRMRSTTARSWFAPASSRRS